MKRFGTISGLRARLLPMNKLRLVAPTNVFDAASRDCCLASLSGRSRAKAPAMPQPPSYNFIRYRMTRQQPDAPNTNPGITRVNSAPSGVSLQVADKIASPVLIDLHR